MERQKYFKVRYAGKLIKVIPAHTKWEAIDRVYNENIGKYIADVVVHLHMKLHKYKDLVK